MEDPVAVFGRSDDTAQSFPKVRTTKITCIHVPNTEWYIHDIVIYGEERMTHMYNAMKTYYYGRLIEWSFEHTVMSSMVAERAYLIDLIDRYVESCKQPCRSYCIFYFNTEWPRIQFYLKAWKTQLVLERIRRNIAARTIQRQFRESMSNPGYRLCKQRLLREFAEGIKNHLV